MALGNEDFACKMVVLVIHAHADSEHQLDAFIETASAACATAIEGAVQQHPGVDLMEAVLSAADDDEEDDL